MRGTVNGIGLENSLAGLLQVLFVHVGIGFWPKLDKLRITGI